MVDMADDIPPLNLFMMCAELDRQALRSLPDGYSIRNCRKSEYQAWKDLHIDLPEQADAYNKVLDEYFDLVYSPKGDLFFERCAFVCDVSDTPVGTCMIWPAYGGVSTLHWLKVRPIHEDKGLGRALMSYLLAGLSADDYPVYLHTHPSSYRAIKLYSDFGFKLITDRQVGFRVNDLQESLPILERYMPAADFQRLGFVQAPPGFLQAALQTEYEQF